MPPLTRFAPSPTGWLHLGHALSALEVWHDAAELGAGVLLRIEDIDHTRCRPEFDAAIIADLDWLGLTHSGAVLRQSSRGNAYRDALDRLRRDGLIYPCFCTRAEIRSAATETGFEGPIYPGTCRNLSDTEGRARLNAGESAAWRLKLDRALPTSGPITWQDRTRGLQRWNGLGWGDVVLARKDIGTSYHLAVTVDDAHQQITHVTRGADLFEATHIHVLLQRLLGLPTPIYRHHGLIGDSEGEKLSKRNAAPGLRALTGDGGWLQIQALLKAVGVETSRFDHLGPVNR